jgi:biofilm PGA synthesis lipoprotein PgaB
MLRRIFVLLVFLAAQAAGAQTYQVITYHDIKAVGASTVAADDVSVRRLADHFDWLAANGYTVIAVQDLLDAQSGVKALPPKPILLTFDDAYASFYELAYPLLKAYRYPATLAVVGSWLENAGDVSYGDATVERGRFMSLAQLKEVAASGLVEIASHSYDLHRGIVGNAEGNTMPAATTLAYDTVSGSYETQAAYVERVASDLRRNSDFIERLTGKRPRVMAWPYGRYSGEAQRIAANVGMAITMNLDDGENRIEDGLAGIRRYYLKNDPTAAELASTLGPQRGRPMRVMHVDLDYIYDPDPAQQEKNLGLQLERIKAAGVTAVFLQAYADPDAAGVAHSLYFPNRHLPVKADLFGRASWQIATRTGARVFAWLPLTAFAPPPGHRLAAQGVLAADGSLGVGYARLSPFSAEVREYVAEIYEDLARHAYFDGLLIHDDATLSDQEDASEFALDYYADRLGLPRSIAAIRADPELMRRWAAAKTEHLSWLAGELRRRAENFRKPLLLARNYYAAPILDAAAEERFAQSLPDALRRFDWIALMAMPYLEKADDASTWLARLVKAVQDVKGADGKVIFELQARRWSPDAPIPSAELAGWMHELRVAGIRHFGYYPDDPFANQPDISIIRNELSAQRYAR